MKAQFLTFLFCFRVNYFEQCHNGAVASDWSLCFNARLSIAARLHQRYLFPFNGVKLSIHKSYRMGFYKINCLLVFNRERFLCQWALYIISNDRKVFF